MLIGGAGEEGLANIDCNIVAMSKACALTYIDYLRSNVAANLIVVKICFCLSLRIRRHVGLLCLLVWYFEYLSYRSKGGTGPRYF